MARFGLLFARGGNWRGRQIISTDWVRESTRTHSITSRKNRKSVGYGYTHAPQIKINGILLQEMVKGRAEVLLGMNRDPSVGATITLGMGGVLAEIYNDHATRMAPVTVSDANEMIREVKGLSIIRGFRKLPLGDVNALALAISRFSQIALDERVKEAEINPLIVASEGEGCVAVDAVLRLV